MESDNSQTKYFFPQIKQKKKIRPWKNILEKEKKVVFGDFTLNTLESILSVGFANHSLNASNPFSYKATISEPTEFLFTSGASSASDELQFPIIVYICKCKIHA